MSLPSFPRFAPERFVIVRPKHTDRHKAFRKGLEGMPNPVVSVEEIQRVAKRVEVLENLRS